jgi:transposase
VTTSRMFLAGIEANQSPAATDTVTFLIVLSDGTVIDLPRTTTADRKRLADAQQIAARRTKGSRYRPKAQRRVARLQAKFARRRKDAVHKATTMLAKNHGVIVIGDLKVAAMTKSGKGTLENPDELVQKQANQNRYRQSRHWLREANRCGRNVAQQRRGLVEHMHAEKTCCESRDDLLLRA